MRIIAIVLLSFVAPLFWWAVLHFVVPTPALEWTGFVLGWILTPAVLLHLWRPQPSLDVMAIDRSEPEMRDAIARAQAELPRFLAGLAHGTKEAFVKYPIATQRGTTEHVWGVAHRQDGQAIVASLASEPVMALEDAFPARERIPLHAIEDWMLTDRQGRAEGGYSHLAMVQIYRRIHRRAPRRSELTRLDVFVDIHPRQYESVAKAG